MKAILTSISVTIALFAGGSLAWAGKGWTKAESSSGNFCHDQAKTYLKNKLGPQIKFIAKFDDKAREKNGLNYVTWFKTNLCDGYFAFNYGSTKWEKCKRAHYGRVPIYVSHMWATGSCKKLMPSWFYNITRADIETPYSQQLSEQTPEQE